MEPPQKNKILELVAHFPEIKLLYFFGSRARGNFGPTSDFDFAIYIDTPDKNREIDVYLSFAGHITKAVGSDNVDVVPLHTLDRPELAYNIIYEGKVLYEVEPYRAMIEPRIMQEYFDFKLTSNEYLQSRISLVKQYLSYLEKYKNVNVSDLTSNEERRGAVERYLYLAIQASIDLAEIVISIKNYRKAQTLSETFEILLENNILDQNLCEKLVKMVGFRNILSHGYHKVDYNIVCQALGSGLNDIKLFIKTIESL